MAGLDSHDKAWNVRERVLVTLLERYAELVDGSAGNGLPGSGDHVPLMPRTYTASVRELERLLVKLREERHSVWWHVNERYIKATTRTLFKCPKCGGESHAATHRHTSKSGKASNYRGERVVALTWDNRVNSDKVKKGVRWLDAQWALSADPRLPQELLAA